MAKSSADAKSSPYMVDVRTLAALGLTGLIAATLIGFYLWMVRPAAAREALAACNGMRPTATTPTLGALPVAAPDFEAKGLPIPGHDQPVTLSQFRGKVVLLNFWASWCGVCKIEKPKVYEVAENFDSDDLVVLTMASDTNPARVLVAIACAHDASKVPERFCRESPPPDVPTWDEARDIFQNVMPDGTPYQVYLDTPVAGDGTIGTIARRWGVEKVPDSFLIDRMGRIRYYFSNKRDWGSSVAETCIRSVVDE
jgi:thiol-disulfide isomerase/thioredoxin